MTRFSRTLLISYFLFFCVFSISCKGTKDKIISKTGTEKLDSLPLILRRYLEKEKLNNEQYENF